MSDDPRQILLSYAGQIVDTVLLCLGKGNVESIVLSGGAARNDIAAFRTPDRVEIYSDLDLYVIVRRARDLHAARAEVRRAVAALPKETETYCIFPDPDVGVYSENDLMMQKTRPGTVELAETHVVLHGNPETPRCACKFVASAIDPDEGLYLLENRMAEIAELTSRLERRESDGFDRYVHYVRMKSGLDAVTAILVALDRFRSRRDERMSVFREMGSRGVLWEVLPEGAAECIERCFAGLGRLQETLETARYDRRGPAGDVESVLLGVWLGIAKRLGPAGAKDWVELLDWRCKAGRWLGNLKELSVLGKRMSVRRIEILLRWRTLGRLSPVDALRLAGAVELLFRPAGAGAASGVPRRSVIEERYVTVLDELAQTFGYRAAPVFDRARRMFRETS